ncbi:phenylacetate--CoA ligase family protein [Photobacterium atrarenae]|uniref:Phenylacetate--CoA ligase family protein n=1 Tax=Photobacterium atrarenae TaxID=865757 RepID=A0ABY5GCS3_9GAMM|nr:hypothetical protein [Photobacterium atrarenae]UTV26986.1 hypothetical protein NNL38_11600 [Photobacterium atrarenae]
MFKDKLKGFVLDTLPEDFWPYQKDYLKVRKVINDSNHFTKEQMVDFQFNRMKELIDYTWKESKGYREYWSDNNFNPSDFKSLSDVVRIPFISKEVIRDNIELFSIKNSNKPYVVSTSGSTGKQFQFYQTKKIRAQDTAFVDDLWSHFYSKMSRKTKRTFLRGGIQKNSIQKDPFFGLRLSSREISAELVFEFINAIDKYKTPIFHVYPSSLYLMCKIMIENGINRPKHIFDVICFGSEPIYEFQLSAIKKIFHEPLSFCYGNTEKVAFGGNCSHNDAYHMYPQYGYTELVDSYGEPVSKGQRGEIVGTSFWNFQTPFIRYKTGDMAVLGDSECKFCDKKYQLLSSIEGRMQEYVVSKSKSIMPITYFSSIHDDTFETIKQFRFQQKEIGVVDFLYLRKENLETDISSIRQRLEFALGNGYDLNLIEVENINLSKSGKMTYLDQFLDINQFM